VVAAKEMAKQKATDPAGADTESGGDEGNPVTTVKCYERIKTKVNQLCSLLNLKQPDVFALYERHMDEDLLRELARRQQELRKSRKD
jgi:hypothetical protein